MIYRLLCISLLFLGISQAHAAGVSNDGNWTELQMKKYCYYRAVRASVNPNTYVRCMETNKTKLGKPKNPGAMHDLKAADKLLTKKARQHAPATNQPSTQEPISE